MCIYLSWISAAAAACVAIRLLLLQRLPHAAAVRHGVPDGPICCCGPLRPIPAFSLSSLPKHDFLSMCVVRTASRYCRLLQPQFTSCIYYKFSVITRTRGVKAGVIPPRRRPPCIFYVSDLGHVIGWE